MKLLISLLALSTLGFAQKKPDAQAPIEKQIARYVQGMQKKDIKIVASVMTPDFKAVTKTGMAAQGTDVLDGLKKLFGQVKKISLTCKIQSLKMEKRNAHLVTHNIMDIEVPDDKGNIGTLRTDSTNDEIWVPANGSYKIIYSKQLTNKVTLNGRPIQNGGG
jgi:ketosteroid isomerase-like protein